jgi:hypothetical protein
MSPVSRPFWAKSSPRYWYAWSLSGVFATRSCQNAMRRSVSPGFDVPIAVPAPGGSTCPTGSSTVMPSGREPASFWPFSAEVP